MIRRTHSLVLFVLLLFTLSGCGAMFDPGPPPAVYALSPSFASSMAGQHNGKSSLQLSVAMPAADEMLAGNRIITRYPDGELRVWKNAGWVSSLPAMLQQQLIAGYEKAALFTVLPSDASGFNADYSLLTDIRHFSVIMDQAGNPASVQVQITAHVMDLRSGRSLGYLNSDKLVELAPDKNLKTALAAFDQAAGQAISEICTWSSGIVLSRQTKRP